MNDFPRQQLHELIKRHGIILIKDAERCESLLRQKCGNNYRLEIFLLVNAIKGGVTQALLNPPQNSPQDAWLAQLTQDLHDNQLRFLGLEKDLAKWAVQSWEQILSQVAKPLKRLSALNPIDYIRLLWWILVKPQQLQIYRQTFGEEDEDHVGKWLVSTLIWGPLLMPILASGLGLLSLVPEESPPGVYLLFIFLLIGCWLLTGWLGNVGEGSVMGNVTFAVMFGMLFGVVYVVAIVIAFLVAMATSEAYGVAYIVAYAVAFYIAYVVAIGAALAVKDTVTNSLITGTPSSIVRLAFLLLVAAYLFLFWFCFLEGEQFVKTMAG
jgi:hypothetical protein